MNWLKQLGANIYLFILLGLIFLLLLMGGIKVFGSG
ncbi:hypothetical protein SAMN06264849_107121 [Melghirimyces algeriensis]|uniref:Uncharacterized protein n=1 Tax=Melghirimyces algeriensis TaxID=910412 RepID=A0A521E3N2_9BACL|nr:hypothetical protein SAMN06264849_107121 [Melghirimyces algeriensis]